MSAPSEPEAASARKRNLLFLSLGDDEDDDGAVVIDHVYLPEGAACCHDCGGPAHDPGMVGLIVDVDDKVAGVLLTPGQALIVAERLQRAASLVLESGEDVPDLEREATRYAAPERAADDAPGSGAA